MPRSWDWVAVQFAIVLVFISLVGASWIIATGSSGELAAGEPAPLGEPEDGDRIRLATRAADVFVLLTASPTGSVEITAIPGDERALPVQAVRASANSDTLKLRTGCGWNCFRSDHPVLRGTPVDVAVDVRRSGGSARAMIRVPARIPPAAPELMRSVNRRMGKVRTVRARETLSNGRTTLRTEFVFRAPNQMRYRMASGPKAIVIGGRRWDWSQGRWQLSTTDEIRAPGYSWNGAGQPRVLGTTVVGGRRLRLLSLFRLDDPRYPAWFRLFVTSDNRVLRADMLAPAHFMVDRFSGFDEPVVIRPPA
jgi:hypothetical protein